MGVRIHEHIFATMVFRPHSAANRWLLPTSVKQYCLEDPLKVRIHGHIFATMVFRPHSADKRWLLPTRAQQYCLEDGIFASFHCQPVVVADQRQAILSGGRDLPPF